MASSPQAPEAEARREARERAIAQAAETMGELVTFWGFKASMGKIWSLLYLTPSPLPADEIAIRTGLSAGAVSMSLAELQQWGLVDRAVNTEDRRRHFRAETDVWGIVRRIFRERELRLVGRAKAQFQGAYDLLADGPDQDEETRFAMARLRSLIELASLGYTLLEGFAAVGQLSLEPIRGALAFARDRS